MWRPLLTTPGHRLAHAAADVADDAAPLDLAAGLGQRRAERIAERQVAQVADVQRLGRVGVPEVERVGATRGEVGCDRRPRRRRARRRCPRPTRLESRAQTCLPLRSTSSTQGSASIRSSAASAAASSCQPLTQGTSIRSKRSCGWYGRPRRPQRPLAVASRHLVEVVKEIVRHSRCRFHWQCTSRGSNPDLRLLRPAL